jgi:hypothetical protein
MLGQFLYIDEFIPWLEQRGTDEPVLSKRAKNLRKWRQKSMVLERKDLDGTESQISGGRTPLELEPGEKVKVVVRGLGTYEGGQKKDFERQELMDEKIVNAALIVCNPEDAEEEYIVSSPIESVMGTAILNFGQKNDEGVYYLKEELLNVIGWLGVKEVKTKEEYEHGYKQLYWDAEETAKGKVKVMKDAPEGASLVGADQRGDDEDVTEEEGLI